MGMKRAFRTVSAILLLAALCFVAVAAGVVVLQSDAPFARAQAAPDTKETEEKSAEEQPDKPVDLFADLPTDGMIEGVVPEKTTKVAVLRAANVNSINDVPENDLSSSDQHIAEGLHLMLEQKLQYLPQIITENAEGRVTRFGARLRDPDVPHAGDKEIVGRKNARLNEGLETFNADMLLVLSFVPGEEGTIGLVYRYSADKGVHESTEWTFGKIGKPEPDSVTRQLEAVVDALVDGVGVSCEHAPVPRLVMTDKALRAFARMTIAFKAGNATEAWVEYESLLKYDSRAGRSAHYAMEMFQALAQEQSNAQENQKYLHRAIKAGRDALAHVPNDTHIRGRLGWNGAMHFGRMQFGRKAIEQALQVQPANMNEIERYLTVYQIESVSKQNDWLIKYAMPKIKNGQIEAAIGLNLFNRGEYAEAVDWYKKAQAIAPGEFEVQLSAGLCGFYKAETLAKELARDEARIAYADATDALKVAIRIDQQEVPYVYDYYVRAATHGYTQLPTQADDLEEIFLVQTVLTALQSSSRTFQWDRLVKDVLGAQKRLLKATVKEVEPDDELYLLKLMARLRLSFTDQDTDDVIHTLWLTKEAGYRPEIYYAYMNSFAPLVHEYEPAEPDPPEEGESAD